jgi:glycosyltransferase involved in cell wall biosynthesis
MSTPLITIGMTAYNAEGTIEKALNSALAQDWPNFEIVVVDDCSEDGTADIVRQFAKHDSRIRYFRQSENKGVAATRNRIINEARGEFIAFFDDDDESLPERLSKQHGRITNYERDFARNEPVICHTARTQIYPDATERYEGTLGTETGSPAPKGTEVANMILFNAPVKGGGGSQATCSQMARKTVYERMGGFDEDFKRAEDTEFNLRFALSGGHFPGIAEPLVKQTMTPGTDKNLKDERFFTVKIYNRYARYLANHGRGTFDLEWAEAKYDFLEKRWMRFLAGFFLLSLSHPLLSGKKALRALPNMNYNMVFQRFHHRK